MTYDSLVELLRDCTRQAPDLGPDWSAAVRAVPDRAARLRFVLEGKRVWGYAYKYEYPTLPDGTRRRGRVLARMDVTREFYKGYLINTVDRTYRRFLQKLIAKPGFAEAMTAAMGVLRVPAHLVWDPSTGPVALPAEGYEL